jgi:hypothetical protein
MKTIKFLSVLASLFLLLTVTTANAQQDKHELGSFNLGDEHLDVPQKSPMIKAAGPGGAGMRAQKDSKTGKTYGPNDMIQIPEGKSVPASVYFAEIEKLEREFNAKGYSIENGPAENTVGKVKVNEADLARQRSSMPAAGKFISEADIKGTFKAANTVGGVELKSLDAMTEAEFNAAKASKVHIRSGAATAGDLQGTEFKVSTGPAVAGVGGVSAAAPGALVKSISQAASKSWVYGSTSSFQASISGSVSINGRVYQPGGNLNQMSYAAAKAELAKTSSEFNFASSGRVDGTLFGKGFNVLNITGNSRVPANSAQNANIGINVSVVGINIFNFAQNFPQSFNISSSKSAYKEIRYTYRTVIVVVPVSGSVGVKGTVGINYGISGDKLSLTANVTPFAELAGFAEAAIDLLIVKAGVLGTITFVRGSIPLQAQLYISINNGIIIGERLYAGYNLNFLSGTIQLFAKVWTFWSGWKSYYYTLWSTGGYNISGAFANYQNSQFIPW